MKLLHRLVLIWFITSILGLGMAYATSFHDMPVVGGAHAVSDVANGAFDPDHESGGDHCNHGASHLLVVHNDDTAARVAVDRGKFHVPSSVRVTSRHLSAPFRPPASA